MENSLKRKILPVTLAIVVIVLDQITKMLVVNNIPLGTIGASFLGDFFQIIHVANKGVAFSMGSSWSQNIRALAFIFVPLIVVILVIHIYFRNKDFTKLQRWTIMGTVGGGIGNLIDRIFRPTGVVDFIDIKFYGFLGFNRWPTFNIADAAIVICGIILAISFLRSVSNSKEE